MRGKTTQQLSFGEGFIDPKLYELDDELKKVDQLLNNREFLKPFETVFDETMGRPGTPVDVYLRMMYLKFRWGLSYEEVETEVRERIPWRLFCHLSLMERVPDSTTLIKLNQRFGEELITALNKKLIKYLVKTKSIKPRKIRIDSTTIESNIVYPTDIGLLHQTVKTLTRTVKKLGGKISDHSRATKKALARLGASLKSKGKQKKEQAQKTLKAVNKLAQDTLSQCRRALPLLEKKHNTETIERLTEQIKLGEKILEQTQQKLQGAESIPDRIVSFHDPEARIIRKGKLSKPNEFGRTVQLMQCESGVILHYDVHQGNPNDKTQAVPLVKKFKKEFHCSPTDVAADKGYYSQENIEKLSELGVQRVAIPKIGRLNPKEHRKQKSRWFKALQRFRCGIEAGISMLKRKFLLDRSLSLGTTRTKTWVGFSILTYNLWQMA
jgi:IS5 family transposase